MAYDLKIHRNVEKQLQRIQKNQRERLVETMRSLREDPRPPACVKLDDVLYRVRQGQYRVIYASSTMKWSWWSARSLEGRRIPIAISRCSWIGPRVFWGKASWREEHARDAS